MLQLSIIIACQCVLDDLTTRQLLLRLAMQSNHALCVVRTTNTVKEDHAGLLKPTATYAAQDKYVGPKPLVWIHARSMCTVKK